MIPGKNLTPAEKRRRLIRNRAFYWQASADANRRMAEAGQDAKRAIEMVVEIDRQLGLDGPGSAA